jgi:hypothetical protein
MTLGIRSGKTLLIPEKAFDLQGNLIRVSSRGCDRDNQPKPFYR